LLLRFLPFHSNLHKWPFVELLISYCFSLPLPAYIPSLIFVFTFWVFLVIGPVSREPAVLIHHCRELAVLAYLQKEKVLVIQPQE
jgi:hypothetical protein